MWDQHKNGDLPAYVPFDVFLNLLDRLESAGIPQRIDRGYWRQYMSGAIGAQLMGALRFLGLINSAAEPEANLGGLVATGQRREVLRQLLAECYRAIFELADPKYATRTQLNEAFEEAYAVNGDTRRKAVTFFLKAAKYAELPLSSYVLLRSAPVPHRPGGKPPRGRPRRKAVATLQEETEVQRSTGEPPIESQQITLKGGGTITLSISVNWLGMEPPRRSKLLNLVDAFNELRSEADT
jgi:hypothetical protein